MITDVQFENFRCFKEFSLGNIHQITLISGQNGSGKTTVLEGIALFLSLARHDVLSDIGTDMRMLYHEVAAGKAVRISIAMDDSDRKTLAFSQKKHFSAEISMSIHPGSSAAEMPSDAAMLNFLYTEGDEEAGSCSLKRHENSLRHVRTSKNKVLPAFPRVFYFAQGRLIHQQTAAALVSLIEAETGAQELRDSLSLFVPDMTDIFVPAREAGTDIFCLFTTGKVLPLRAMGSGMQKLVSCLAVMTANPGSVFLIDEIESGFHYSFYDQLWKFIFATADHHHCQIIATTHSSECLAAASNVAKSLDNTELSYLRLDSTDGSPHSVYYTPDTLQYSLQHGMEVR